MRKSPTPSAPLSTASSTSGGFRCSPRRRSTLPCEGARRLAAHRRSVGCRESVVSIFEVRHGDAARVCRPEATITSPRNVYRAPRRRRGPVEDSATRPSDASRYEQRACEASPTRRRESRSLPLGGGASIHVRGSPARRRLPRPPAPARGRNGRPLRDGRRTRSAEIRRLRHPAPFNLVFGERSEACPVESAKHAPHRADCSRIGVRRAPSVSSPSEHAVEASVRARRNTSAILCPHLGSRSRLAASSRSVSARRNAASIRPTSRSTVPSPRRETATLEMSPTSAASPSEPGRSARSVSFMPRGNPPDRLNLPEHTSALACVNDGIGQASRAARH